MQKRIDKQYFILKLLLEIVIVNCAFLSAYYLCFNDIFADRSTSSAISYKNLLVNVNLLFLVINVLSQKGTRLELKNYVYYVVLYMAMIVYFQGYDYSRAFHLYFLSLLGGLSVFLRFSNSIQLLEKCLLSENQFLRVILICDEIDSSIIDHINNRPGNYKCVGVLSDFLEQNINIEGFCQGRVDYLEEILKTNSIDEVLISTLSLSKQQLEKIINITEKYHATFSILPPYFQHLSKQSCQTEYWKGLPVISIVHSKLALKSYQIFKRVLDICISSLFLAGVFPILCLLVAPAIWLSNKGPIFFKQLRKGYKQEPFHCYKFRTMKLNAKAEEVIQAKREDSRITAIGKTLRKTSIDEVPQFLNVLAGNMSIVGPRPHMVEHDEMYDKFISRYNVRFVTKPGITGWAQVNGLRGETEDPKLMEKRIEHDLWYIKNWSLWLDIKIIVKTAVTLIFKGDNNAY